MNEPQSSPEDESKVVRKPGDDIPNGSIQAISTAACTALALEIAFLGYWAFGSQTANTSWNIYHLAGVLPFTISFWLLATVPFDASAPDIRKEKFNQIRTRYGWGAIFLSVGLAISMLLSVDAISDWLVPPAPKTVSKTFTFTCTQPCTLNLKELP